MAGQLLMRVLIIDADDALGPRGHGGAKVY
jgi:hypothetical protein